MACFQCFLNATAYLSLFYILYRFIRSLHAIVYPYLIAKPLDLHKLAGHAKWAVITGSTDGIGKAYAIELGKRGFNLLLISRSEAKLESVKEEISKICTSVEIDTIAYDFKNAKLEDYKKELIPTLQRRYVGILVNNVGVAHDFPDFTHKIDIERTTDICVVNDIPISILTAAILPQMVERNAGVIVNVSSGAAYVKMPYVSVYSASKAYINHFSNILRNEYSDTNIVIQTLCPLYVVSNMSKVQESKFNLSPTRYAESAVKTIGIVAETTGCLQHQIQASFLGLPEFIVSLGKKYQKGEFERNAQIHHEKAAKKE